MSDLGTLTASLGADLGPLNRSVLQAEASFRRYQNSGTRALNTVKKSVLSLKTAFVGIGLTAVIADVIKTGAQYEQTMAEVKGISRATEEQFARMDATVKRLGETTEWTAKQAGEGMKFLAMAGFEAEQTIAALPGVLDLATAGNIELGRAADIASNALTAMRLPVEQLSRVNDVFVKTITTSNVNMEMMAESFKYAASVGAAFGYDVETISGLIGKLGNAGIQGSMAGTQLAMAFQQSGKVFEKYGNQLKSGERVTQDLIGALKILEDRGADATEVIDIFGQRAGRGMAALLGQGVKSIEDYIQAIKDCEGSSKALADIMRSTTIGAFKELQSALEGVKIATFAQEGGVLAEVLKDTTRYIRENKDVLVDLVSTALAGAIKGFRILVEVLNTVGQTFEMLIRIAVAAFFAKLASVVIPATIAAVQRLRLDVHLLSMSFHSASGAAAKTSVALKALNTALWGTSLSIKGVIKAVTSLNALFAGIIGYEIGTWLHNQFETARLAGVMMVDALGKSILWLQYTWERVTETMTALWARFVNEVKGMFGDMLRWIGDQLERIPEWIPFGEVLSDMGAAFREVAPDVMEQQKLIDAHIEKMKQLREAYEDAGAAHRAIIDEMIVDAMRLRDTGLGAAEGQMGTGMAPLLNEVDALISQMNEVKNVNTTTQAEIEELIRALELQRDTFWMTAEEAQLYELRQKGLGEVVDSTIAPLMAQIRALEEQKAAMEVYEQAMMEIDKIGKSYEQLEKERIQSIADEWIRAGVDRVDVERWVAAEIEKIHERTHENVTELNEFQIQAYRSMQSAASDLFFKPWEDGLDGLLQKFLDTMQRIAAEWIATQAMMGLFGKEFGKGGPLGGLLGTIAGAFTGNAYGNAFSGGHVIPFARGGVVNQPTIFPMAQGAGLMGEAGPEAILPLTRIGGDLGVKAVGGGSEGQTVNNYFVISSPDAEGFDRLCQRNAISIVRATNAALEKNVGRKQMRGLLGG